MEPIVQFGPLIFRLKDATVASLPDFTDGLVLLLDAGGERIPVRPVVRDGRTLLIVDHRAGPADEPARVEYWECLSGAEGDIAGLLALCDAAPDARPAGRPGSAALAALRLLSLV